MGCKITIDNVKCVCLVISILDMGKNDYVRYNWIKKKTRVT